MRGGRRRCEDRVHDERLAAESRFTERQRQVVRLIAEGCSNEEIAERLGVSPRTAKAHCERPADEARREPPAVDPCRRTATRRARTPSRASSRRPACPRLPARRADRSRGMTAPRARGGCRGHGVFPGSLVRSSASRYGSLPSDTGAASLRPTHGAQRSTAALPPPSPAASIDAPARRERRAIDPHHSACRIRQDDACARMAGRAQRRGLVPRHSRIGRSRRLLDRDRRRSRTARTGCGRAPSAAPPGRRATGARARRPMAELLAEDLEAWPAGGARLVLDDYHLVAESAPVEEFVDWLLTLAPLRVLVTSRRRPGWAPARRFLHGEIVRDGPPPARHERRGGEPRCSTAAPSDAVRPSSRRLRDGPP